MSSGELLGELFPHSCKRVFLTWFNLTGLLLRPTTTSLLGVGLHSKPSIPVCRPRTCPDYLFNPINASVQDFMAGGCVLGTAYSYMKFKTYIQSPDSTKS